VTFEHDLIVPWKSAVELVERAGSTDKERLHLKGGHVGAVVSRKAAQGLWSKLSEWWAARDAAPTPAVTVAEVPADAPAMRDAAPSAPAATRSQRPPRAQASARRGKRA
jgi:polyhydroxyalkanoate synthase